MPGNKESQELSVVGRLLSLEALLFLMGTVSLGHGVVTLQFGNIIIGAAILVAALVLARRWRRLPSRQQGAPHKGERQ